MNKINESVIKLSIYNSVIAKLLQNDNTSTWDEILTECDTIEDSIECLKNCLQRMIDEEELEISELAFYNMQLARVQELI